MIGRQWALALGLALLSLPGCDSDGVTPNCPDGSNACSGLAAPDDASPSNGDDIQSDAAAAPDDATDDADGATDDADGASDDADDAAREAATDALLDAMGDAGS